MSQFNQRMDSVIGMPDYLIAFEAAVKQQVERHGKSNGFTLVSDITIHSNSDYSQLNSNGDYSYFGYVPMKLCGSAMVQFPGRAPIVWTMQYGLWHHDISNCGVGHFHNLNNHGNKGMGSQVLCFLENWFLSYKKKFITCTTTKHQEADAWLEKKGYTAASEFIGGNSRNRCTLFCKDLNESPIIKIKEYNV